MNKNLKNFAKLIKDVSRIFQTPIQKSLLICFSSMYMVLASLDCSEAGKKSNASTKKTSDTDDSQEIIANAGPDAFAALNVLYQLDGSESTGAAPLNYSWALDIDGCGAGSLTNPASIDPIFIPTVEGQCVISLIVSDDNGNSSPSDSLIITATQAPIAIAGVDDNALVGAVYVLDGSNSSGDTSLSYAWTLDNDGCTAGSLIDAETASPSFTPTTAGTCQISLIVKLSRFCQYNRLY